jgi:hypothetical protein
VPATIFPSNFPSCKKRKCALKQEFSSTLTKTYRNQVKMQLPLLMYAFHHFVAEIYQTTQFRTDEEIQIWSLGIEITCLSKFAFVGTSQFNLQSPQDVTNCFPPPPTILLYLEKHVLVLAAGFPSLKLPIFYFYFFPTPASIFSMSRKQNPHFSPPHNPQLFKSDTNGGTEIFKIQHPHTNQVCVWASRICCVKR